MRDTHDIFNEHIRDVNKYSNFKLYHAMREYGIYILYISLFEEVNVETTQELRKKRPVHQITSWLT